MRFENFARDYGDQDYCGWGFGSIDRDTCLMEDAVEQVPVASEETSPVQRKINWRG